MPIELERSLKKQALKKFGTTTSKRARKYIYGTLRKTGWVPSGQKRHSVKKSKYRKRQEKYTYWRKKGKK